MIIMCTQVKKLFQVQSVDFTAVELDTMGEFLVINKCITRNDMQLVNEVMNVSISFRELLSSARHLASNDRTENSTKCLH